MAEHLDAEQALMRTHIDVGKSIGLEFWWLGHRDAGLNPGSDTCVFEQDTLIISFSPPRGKMGTCRAEMVYDR